MARNRPGRGVTATVLIEVAPRVSIWRKGHCYSGGDQVTVGHADAAKLIGRGMAQKVRP